MTTKFPIFLCCSSPSEMYLSISIGRYAAIFAGLITSTILLIAWHRKALGLLPVAIVCLLVHPAWSMDVSSGDCGDSMRFFSGVVSTVMIGLLICHTWIPWITTRVVLLSLCVLFWSIYVPLFLAHHGFLQILPADTLWGHVIQSYVMSFEPIWRIALLTSGICLGYWLFVKKRKERRIRGQAKNLDRK